VILSIIALVAHRRWGAVRAQLGDFAGTPLGLAGADRMRGGEAYAG